MADKANTSPAARTVSGVDSPAAIRNVVLVGPSGAGKTTLVEALLVASGVLSRPGSVEGGSTVCDFDEAAPYARRDLFGYAMAEGYARMFRHAGFEAEIDQLRERYAAGDRDGAVEAISDEMVQAIDFIGTPAQVNSFVASYVDAGVDHPILMPLPWGADRRAVAEATIRAAAGRF